MKVEIWSLGNPSEKYLQEGEAHYIKRLQNFGEVSLEIIRTSKIKSTNPNQIKKKESELIQNKLRKSKALLIILDEKGKQMTSAKFAAFFHHTSTFENRHLIFLIGGAFGFDESIYQMAHAKIALSQLTFPHQLVRILMLEQLYRAFSIINRLPYHHV